MRRRESFLRSLTARELGPCRPRTPAVDASALSLRASTVALSSHLELTPRGDAVTTLSLEAIDERYLLAGCADASVALYDVADTPSAPPRGPPQPRRPVVQATRRSCRSGHTGAVACVQWFPHDTGAFVSGGYDALVKLWDTNTMSPACDFESAGRVHCVCMSEVASRHNLIAACADGDDREVVLYDPNVGHAAHRLCGHRGVPWALAWHHLVSGGSDGSLRLWDIRKNIRGCLRSFDVHHTFARAGPPRSAAGAGGGRPDATGDAPSLAAAARRLAEPKAHLGGITSVAFSADGSVLLSSGRDQRLRLRPPRARFGGVACAGSRVYFPTADAVRVYDLHSGALLQTLKGHFGEALCAAAAASDHKVFTGGDDCSSRA
ncbi:hypothetical protein EMIHUDRAFT_100311 [Emiliania huxleyi CCMP1516]|uniref:Uncharacterized protein n=2 Tax=Emiliania huxleyi TaxID=2903 RepID=A0A0D3JUF6_EMIH1|nr:hypothetical protein EMIHUDRAFT_100311 [Emiliania huxleyi CCMP1516]EOD27141.1 hypothetical protein EMIHUDRAFT_100311 [Emiliania huxleyi CCMP1516]|eukprot:XP_005779570.1 hypothetical protein EMIHUDRAFT_100311 [Emiliania huxleyi CCMP1516]